MEWWLTQAGMGRHLGKGRQESSTTLENKQSRLLLLPCVSGEPEELKQREGGGNATV